MGQKDIFEKLYAIIFQKGSERAIDAIEEMYDCYVNSNREKQDFEYTTILKDELISILKDTQEYKDSIGTRGMSEVDRIFLNRQKIIPELLKQDLSAVENKDTIFYNKKVVVTGVFFKYPVRNFLANDLKKLGADINTSISKSTNIVCLGGNGVGPSKMETVKKLQASGIEIKVILEEELYKILENSKNKLHI